MTQIIQIKEWKEVSFYKEASEEADEEFKKLQEAGQSSNVRTGNRLTNRDDEDILMKTDLLWSVTPRQEYQDLLAPFDQTEDFSTASQLKNKGPNLTMEVLASL